MDGKELVYLLILILLFLASLYYLYIKKDLYKYRYRLKKLEKKFIKGNSEPSDKQSWEKNLRIIMGIAGGINDSEHFTIIHFKFMEKHYPGVRPEFEDMKEELLL